MKVQISNAIKIFYPNPSFEMIYFEALANALDAEATEVSIDITVPNMKQLQNLEIVIRDNGVGFTEERFKKFEKLLDVEEQSHKGLGRLVYLVYFKNVKIDSFYDSTFGRSFLFNEDFEGENEVINVPNRESGTILKLYGFSGQRLHSNNYIKPYYLKKAILEQFYMKLYKAKLAEKNLVISIRSNIGGLVESESICVSEIPDFEVKDLDYQRSLFEKVELYYNIEEVDVKEAGVITALAVDDRTHKVDIISSENFPKNFNMVFLLISKSFSGEIVDGARVSLNMPEATLSEIKSVFRDAISEVLKEKFPAIVKSNAAKLEYLNNTYPHLQGYFELKEIGYASQSDVLKKAQDSFFKDQREILSANTLTEEQYAKSLDLSARALAEYILFRQHIIQKLQSITSDNLEEDIHNLIAPKRVAFRSGELINDRFRNNVWVFDDKFMTYRTILSEAQMTEVVKEITKNDLYRDSDRPDIVLYFSSDPNVPDTKVDVVIVELKRLGLKVERNSDVESQLISRARALAKYYDNKIQRIWYYGVIEMDEEYVLNLKTDGFTPLYSKGHTYYKQKRIYLDVNSEDYVLANTFLIDYHALVNDAEARNKTFLDILKSNFEN
jgi:hypothetical protein